MWMRTTDGTLAHGKIIIVASALKLAKERFHNWHKNMSAEHMTHTEHKLIIMATTSCPQGLTQEAKKKIVPLKNLT